MTCRSTKFNAWTYGWRKTWAPQTLGGTCATWHWYGSKYVMVASLLPCKPMADKMWLHYPMNTRQAIYKWLYVLKAASSIINLSLTWLCACQSQRTKSCRVLIGSWMRLHWYRMKKRPETTVPKVPSIVLKADMLITKTYMNFSERGFFWSQYGEYWCSFHLLVVTT